MTDRTNSGDNAANDANFTDLDSRSGAANLNFRRKKILEADLFTETAQRLQKNGSLPEALKLYERAYKIREICLGPINLDTTQSLFSMSRIYRELGDLHQAESLLSKNINYLERYTLSHGTKEDFPLQPKEEKTSRPEAVDLKSAKQTYLDAIFDSEEVPAAARDEISRLFWRHISIAKAKQQRIPWNDRNKHEELKGLFAPEFLKTIHADDINDGRVDSEYIRAIDKPLMDAVDAYISGRALSKNGMGRASGLTIVTSRPPRNRRKVSQDRTPS